MAPIIIDTFKQGEPEWLKAIAGSVGASTISKIFTSTGQVSDQRLDLMKQLAGERITGMPEPTSWKSIHMQNGNEREAECRELFELTQNKTVRQVGVVYKDKWKMCHCSPDGLVDENAGAELKNSMLKTHVGYVLEGKLPTIYKPQVQFSLYVTEREKWYFMSNFTGIKPLILECYRDEKWLAAMEIELNKFNEDMLRMVERLK